MSIHGETDLKELLSSIEPILQEDTYVFHSSKISFAEAIAYNPVLMFQEKEGTALILKKQTAEENQLKYHYESKMITLNVHSSLDAVGFLAAITKSLAAADISVNPVSAHYHDHLFIPIARANDAINILNNLSRK